MRGLPPVAASGVHSSSRCAGLSPSRPLLLGSTGSRRAGSAIVAHGPSRSTACGILPDQGPNPCPLHWQADSQPLRHQGSPTPSSNVHVICVNLALNGDLLSLDLSVYLLSCCCLYSLITEKTFSACLLCPMILLVSIVSVVNSLGPIFAHSSFAIFPLS